MGAEVIHLRYVVAAADHASFRRAAATLNITQPTLSKRIREIEDRLGVFLFERSTAGAKLTAAGEEFVISARRVLAELSRMENRARAGQRGDVGRLEIGFYTSLSVGALRDSILIFISRYPEVEVNLIEGSRASLMTLLEQGGIDIAVMLGESSLADFAHLRMWSERVMIAFPESHPLAGRQFVYWTDIKDEQFLISQRDPGPELQDVLLCKLTSPGDRPRIKPFNANRETILSMVGANRGICPVCESATGNTLPGVIFREIRDGNGPTRLGYVVFWRNSDTNPALKKFLGILQVHGGSLLA